MSRRLEFTALISILLLAAAGRLYRLTDIPPGLTHDEADVGYFALAIFHDQPANVNVPYGYAYQPLVHYTVAGLMHLALSRHPPQSRDPLRRAEFRTARAAS